MSAPALKRKPSGIWFWEFADPQSGERRRVSTGTRDKEKARRMAQDIVLGAAPATSAMKNPAPSGFTMQDLFDRAEKTVWAPSETKSQGTVRSNLKVLRPLIGHVPVADMTYTKLEELVDALRAKGYAPGTIKRKMDMVSKALRMATIWTDPATGRPILVSKPTMPSIRVSNLKDRVLERDEEAAVWLAIEARRLEEPGRQWWRFAKLIRYLLDTGARLGEALSTGPENISTIRGQSYVTFARYRTKNDKPRTVPLTPAVAAGFEELKEHIGKRKGEWSYFPLTEGTAWYMWDQVRQDVKKSGFNIDDVTLHTLRHTCLTRLAQGGMDLLRLQKWAGHSDPKITADRYTHLQPGDLDFGLAILDSSNGGFEKTQGHDGGIGVKSNFDRATANRAGAGAPLLN